MAGKDNIIGKGFDARPGDINRSGRPAGSRNRSTIVKEIIEAVKAGQVDGLTEIEVATVAVLEKAKAGDVQAWDKLMDSAYGKVTDKLEADLKADVKTCDVTDMVLRSMPKEQLEAILDQSQHND